jgi:1-deoxy-D-xylulose-5-phosphate synthase
MILERIDSPQDLKRLTVEELEMLAGEIRAAILRIVSATGGHLSSNLGVVELSIALHYVFDAPQDKIVWDVGHQCYTHKILTGRRDRFETLRQDEGLSGFPSRRESEYDIFNTGHASNSISIALGIAEANRKKGITKKTIAVIGDGSLTGGMAFEALNHAGDLKSDIIVVLNDNEMSISRNIGALSSYLNRIMTGEFISNMREEIKERIKGLPIVYKTARKLEETLKGLVTPGVLFEELGFQYVGPVDGHNFGHLIDNLRNIKRLKGPTLIHVVTKKGLGYHPAENDPALFHGIPVFDMETGTPVNHGPTFTDIFGQTIAELAEQDDRIVAVTAAMGLGTGLERFSALFPDRFYDIGIAEQHGVTFAAAMALQGLRPFVAIYSTFLQRAYDQVLLDVCLQELPVVFAIDRSGIVGQDGPTHNGVFDLSYLRHMPNMVLMCPKDENELRHMLYSAHCYGKTSAIRYPRGRALGVAMDADLREIPFGSWEMLREGGEIAIIACGPAVYAALGAAEDLEREGLNVSVVNGRFIKPMDGTMLAEIARKVRLVVTVEENSIIGGFGSGIMERLSEEEIAVPVKRIGIADRFLSHGSQTAVRAREGLDRGGIGATVKRWAKNG